VQFGFIVALPILFPLFAFLAIHWKDFMASYLDEEGRSVGISSSDRGIDFHRRASHPTNRGESFSSDDGVEMSPPAASRPGAATVSDEAAHRGAADNSASFTLKLVTHPQNVPSNSPVYRYVTSDSNPPRAGSLINLVTACDVSQRLHFRADSDNRFRLYNGARGTNPTNLYLSCFGGPPTEGALFTLLQVEQASKFEFNGTLLTVSDGDGISERGTEIEYFFMKYAGDGNGDSVMAVCGVKKRGQQLGKKTLFGFVKE
jgi:hypothetical protein